ncbi:hypothetical protein TNCV_1285801 [Trichonephila clavipes]|uniref:Uncharacterized protein n=1 Tax=Trichonephila clavipes TaxID=2585209 RepID=A0A8X6VQC1_TRICX|nr:hypothetical protein TNCV_1285801 [Trichonephila clavipes]
MLNAVSLCLQQSTTLQHTPKDPHSDRLSDSLGPLSPTVTYQGSHLRASPCYPKAAIHSNNLALTSTSTAFHAEIVEVEIGGVAIYRPFGEFRKANRKARTVTCIVLKANDWRTSSPMPR